MKDSHSQPYDKAEEAVNNFLQGCNCCQSIFCTYGPSLGIEKEEAMKLAEAFGGSVMARTCGAVSGSLMTLGLKYGRTQCDQTENKEKTRDLAKKFNQLFEEKHQSTQCRDLLGHDISTKEGNEAAAQKNLSKTVCPNFVRDAAKILEQLLV